MKFLAWMLLSGLVLTATGCKPDAAVKRGAVVDDPTPKTPSQPVVAQPKTSQQPPLTKVQ